MSDRIRLASIPSQELNVTRDGDRYQITLKADEYGDIIADIYRDDEPLLTGFFVVAGLPLIPYEHLENGNFIFVTDDDDHPNYEKFGSSQYLIYLTADEMGVLRGN